MAALHRSALAEDGAFIAVSPSGSSPVRLARGTEVFEDGLGVPVLRASDGAILKRLDNPEVSSTSESSEPLSATPVLAELPPADPAVPAYGDFMSPPQNWNVMSGIGLLGGLVMVLNPKGNISAGPPGPPQPQSVPEPCPCLALGSGILAAGFRSRRK